jgi:general secretion pathway protein E
MEVMPMTDALRSLIMRHAVSGEIRRQAVSPKACAPCTKTACSRRVAGVTTIDEVLRVTRED